MKNVLIFLKEKDLAPIGGELGYNYTLKNGLDLLDDLGEICFSYLPGQTITKNINNFIKNDIKSNMFKNMVLVSKSVLKKGTLMYSPFHYSRIDLRKYDAIHFHRTSDLYSIKDSLKTYKGKVIITLHTPTMPAKQMISLLSDFEKKYLKIFYKKLYDIDYFALKRADYIIIACEEAEEPYYHEWLKYDVLHSKYKSKYLYMPTGTEAKNKKIEKETFRKKYNIPSNAFVISYVGRHNEIKGYDSLKEIGAELLKKHEDIYFLIAGKEGPLFRLNHERWIELGWTDDPGSIIGASDVFLLSNKETYFDLVMLEVLSLGKVVIASNTGGNKYFSRFSNSGIFLYENEESAIKIIGNVYRLSAAKREMLGKKNYDLYKSYFTNEQFARRYVNAINSIVKV